MANPGDDGVDDEIAYFLAVTGINDVSLCLDILQANDWDLYRAISSVLHPSKTYNDVDDGEEVTSGVNDTADQEAAAFVDTFELEYGGGSAYSFSRPAFMAVEFLSALEKSRRECKLLFVYLHCPDDMQTPRFCSQCLCSEPVAEFLNENFVCWGGYVRWMDGFRISSILGASRFPFCAVLVPTSSKTAVALQKIEGPKHPEEMLSTLQQVLEGTRMIISATTNGAGIHKMLLSEDPVIANTDALEVDQAKEEYREEEQNLEAQHLECETDESEKSERETGEAEREFKVEDAALQKETLEAAENEVKPAKKRRQRTTSFSPKHRRPRCYSRSEISKWMVQGRQVL